MFCRALSGSSLAREGLRFVLVGEDDVDVVAHESAQEFEVFLHDVETRQIERHLKPAALRRAYGLLDQFVVLYEVTFDVETVVTGEKVRPDLFGREFERCAEVGDHRPLAVGRDQRHALAGALLPAEDDRLDAQIVERLLEEVARGVGAHLADEAHAAAQLRHRADRVARRAAQRERVGESRHGFRDFGLEFRVHEAHRAFGKSEPSQHGVGLEVDEHVRQGIADAYYAFHSFESGCLFF